MEQFNPSLRNFISMGKNYEKALAGKQSVIVRVVVMAVALGGSRGVCGGENGKILFAEVGIALEV